MREKIADILYGKLTYQNYKTLPEIKRLADENIDQVLTLITEEIEKVENPFTAERFPLMELALRLECHSSFEVAHNKILALLK